MNRKHVIAVYGGRKTGKSECIKRAFGILKQRYPDSAEVWTEDKDITATFRIKGKIVGVESQGEPNSSQMVAVAEFAAIGCDVILAASRSRGMTVDAIEDLQPDYLVDWINIANYLDPDHPSDAAHALPSDAAHALPSDAIQTLASRLVAMVEEYLDEI